MPPHEQQSAPYGVPPQGAGPYGGPYQGGDPYGPPQPGNGSGPGFPFGPAVPPQGPPPQGGPAGYGWPQQPYGANPDPHPNPFQPANPYGVPGGYPGYPGYPGQQGWYAVERTTNGLAIASLVTSFTCVPLLGLGLGIGGLRQIRRRGQRGRGLAIAGIIVNAITTVIVVLSVVLDATGALDEGNTKVEDVKAGECFNTVGASLSEYGQKKHVSRGVDVVSCDDEHDAEAFAVLNLDPTGEQDYPGADAVAGEAGQRCAGAARGYLGDGSLPDGMDVYTYYPPESSWNAGHTSVTCFFGSRDGKVTGSVKSGGGSGSSDGSSGSDGSGGSSDGGGGSGGSSNGSGGATGGSSDGGVGV